MRNWFKFLGLGLAILLALPVASGAVPTATKAYPLAVAWDMDGEGADADQVLTAANGVLADTMEYFGLISAQPDVCRLIDITVNDVANVTAGRLYITGTDCWGDPLVAMFSFTAGDDDGVKTLLVSTGKASGAYFGYISSIGTDVLTGEGGADTVTVGYTTNSLYGYPAYGTRAEFPTPPYRYVNLDGSDSINVPIGLGASSVLLTAITAATNPFAHVAVGDLVGLNVPGGTTPVQWRKVTARADADNITVDKPLPTLASGGQGFHVKHFFLSTDPQDGWVGVQGWDTVFFVWQVFANANTGGVVSNAECSIFPIMDAGLGSAQVDTDTVASGATGTPTTSVSLLGAPFQYCRFGVKFGTTDDADVAAEDMNLSIALSK